MEEATVYQELAKKSINLLKCRDVTMEWCDTALAVLSDNGIRIYSYPGIWQSFSPKMFMNETLISCPTSSPASKVFPTDFTQRTIKSSHFNQLLLDPSLWPHNPDLMKEMAMFSATSWSPKTIGFGSQCILAGLSNLGVIQLYGWKSQWEIVLDLSSEICELYALKPIINYVDSAENFEKIKATVQPVQTSAYCWIPNVSGVDIVTAQKNGDLLFYSLHPDAVKVKCKLFCKLHIDTHEIISIHCIPQHDNCFLIVCCDIFGQVFALSCESKNQIVINGKVCLWEHSDKMIVKYLHHKLINNNLLVMYAKQRNVVLSVLGSNNTVIFECFKNLNDNRITAFFAHCGRLYVCTCNCKIYELNVLVTGNTYSLEINECMKDVCSGSELHSLSISPNSVIWSTCTTDSQKLISKDNGNTVVISHYSYGNEFLTLFDNPSIHIASSWDCIEVIRCNTMKTKSLPSLNYSKLFSNLNDPKTLRLLLVMVEIYNTLIKHYGSFQNNINLPETSCDKVKKIILVKHACELVKKLHKVYLKHEKLTKFEMETFTCVKKYLEHYCCETETKINDLVNEDVFKINQNDVTFVCQSCDKDMIGLSCEDSHLNITCSVTFTPIADDYLLCRACGALARSELLDEKPLCIFCSVPLIKCVL